MRFASAAVLLALTACNPQQDNGDPPTDTSAKLQRFSSCEDMRGYVADAWLEMLIQSRYGYGRAVDDAAEDGGDGDSGAPTDFSETNTQEEGVDEPDIVETDGEHVYVLSTDATLRIVDSWPADESHLVGELQLDGYPYSMFLDGDRIVVFSYVYEESGERRWDYGTRISVIDVSDRSAPDVLREVDVQGWMADARRIGKDVYLVVNTWNDLPEELWELAWREDLGLPEMDWEASEVQQAMDRAKAREILRPYVDKAAEDADLGDLLPKFSDHAPGEEGEAEPLLDCGDVYRPDGVSRPSVLSVVHLGLDDEDGSEVSASGIMADGWQVYASEDHLYVAQSSWWWWWGWGDMDYETHLHRFALDGADTVYEASGEVDGWVLNQFSMSEHEGDLRVATTDIDWWWGSGSGDEGANNVFVLREDAGVLDTIGEIRGIAPGEQIYSARFMGDRGFLVTFQQVDPLFTLDLADPTAPSVVGELKVPGYSAYLHPVGDDRLLAVGMAGEEDGTILGLQVSLFDVSDFANPAVVDQITVESDDWSWSEALWDHHAFTFHDGVLSIPMYTYDWDEATGDWDGFSGLLVVDVDDAGLTELGRVGHQDLVADSECLYTEWYGADACEYDYWYAGLRRSVVIEGGLYSVSDYGVKINDLHAPDTEVGRVLFHAR